MIHTNFQGHWHFSSGEEDFKGFNYIWAWRPSWSRDSGPVNELLFP